MTLSDGSAPGPRVARFAPGRNRRGTRGLRLEEGRLRHHLTDRARAPVADQGLFVAGPHAYRGMVSPAAAGHLLGRIRLPTGQLVVCGCAAIRGGDDSSDWLDFSIPVGAPDHAGLAYGDGGPFFRSGVMDDWLAGIGAKRTSFALGVIGFEGSSALTGRRGTRFCTPIRRPARTPGPRT